MGVLPELFNIPIRTSLTFGDGFVPDGESPSIDMEAWGHHGAEAVIASLELAWDSSKHPRDPLGRWAGAKVDEATTPKVTTQSPMKKVDEKVHSQLKAASRKAVIATARTGDAELHAKAKEGYAHIKRRNYAEAYKTHTEVAHAHGSLHHQMYGHSFGSRNLAAQQQHNQLNKMLKLHDLWKSIQEEAATPDEDVAASFEGHAGRPGERGGSAPKSINPLEIKGKSSYLGRDKKLHEIQTAHSQWLHEYANAVNARLRQSPNPPHKQIEFDKQPSEDESLYQTEKDEENQPFLRNVKKHYVKVRGNYVPATKEGFVNAVGIVKNGGKFLLGKPIVSVKDARHGKWSLPGGTILANHGETPYFGAKREVYEETGLHTTIVGAKPVKNEETGKREMTAKPFVGDPSRPYVAHFAMEVHPNDQAKVNAIKPHDDEFSELKWMTMKEIKHLEKQGKLHKGTLRVIKRAKKMYFTKTKKAVKAVKEAAKKIDEHYGVREAFGDRIFEYGWDFVKKLAGFFATGKFGLSFQLAYDEELHPREHGRFTFKGVPHATQPLREALSQIEKQYPPARPEQITTQLRQTNVFGRYSPEREAMHEQAVEAVRKDVPVSTHKEFIMMGGGVAAGKSTLMKSGVEYQPNTAVKLAADTFIHDIPEYNAMVKAGDLRAGSYAHDESSDMVKQAFSESLQAGQNVILDATGNASLDGLAKKVMEAHAAGYKVIAEYATCSVPTAKIRARKRAETPGEDFGRLPPDSVIEDTHRNVSYIFPKAVERGLLDEARLWDTEHKTPDGKPTLVMSAVGKKMHIHDPALWNEFIEKSRT